MSVNSAKSQLIQELMQTKEYANLKNIKISLSQNPDYSGEIIKFQKLQESFYNLNQNDEVNRNASEELSKEFERLSKIPEIKRYFNAVNAMTMLINNLINDINMSLDNSLR